jgi:hypothetical protein
MDKIEIFWDAKENLGLEYFPGRGFQLFWKGEDWESRKISRVETLEILAEQPGLCLPEEVAEALADSSPKTAFVEALFLAGLEAESLQTWAAQCYALGVNPLPALRRLLPGWRVSYSAGGKFHLPPTGEKLFLGVIHDAEAQQVSFQVGVIDPNLEETAAPDPLLERGLSQAAAMLEEE